MNTDKLPEIDPTAPGMKNALRMLRRTVQLEAQRVKEQDYIFGESEERAMLYLHGGGFYLPAQAFSLRLAERYAKELDCAVFVPEYPLVPDAGADEIFGFCLREYIKLREKYPKLIVYGESAGGALALGIALRARDEGISAPDGLMLIYPALDDRTDNEMPEAAWTARANRLMWDSYLRNAPQEMVKYLAPMRHEDFSGLPVTYVEAAELDILCTEALQCAHRLGTEANIIRGAKHMFDAEAPLSFAQETIDKRIAFEENIYISDKKTP
ncbi:MAG: alpha/beta fold hydrolase [Oscillospiraceae bacterium]|nr:alpha/beta fold hydrolase [Oscillospiraceae bacterium]